MILLIIDFFVDCLPHWCAKDKELAAREAALEAARVEEHTHRRAVSESKDERLARKLQEREAQHRENEERAAKRREDERRRERDDLDRATAASLQEREIALAAKLQQVNTISIDSFVDLIDVLDRFLCFYLCVCQLGLKRTGIGRSTHCAAIARGGSQKEASQSDERQCAAFCTRVVVSVVGGVVSARQASTSTSSRTR